MISINSDPYKELGVPSTSSSKEIKAAYRKLVKLHHPDAGGDQQKILSLNAAWEILKNKKNRDQYIQKEEKVSIVSPKGNTRKLNPLALAN